jgi:hypothetical protein
MKVSVLLFIGVLFLGVQIFDIPSKYIYTINENSQLFIAKIRYGGGRDGRSALA